MSARDTAERAIRFLEAIVPHITGYDAGEYQTVLHELRGVLADEYQQVGWRPVGGTQLYVERPTKHVDDNGVMWEVDCEWVPVFVKVEEKK